MYLFGGYSKARECYMNDFYVFDSGTKLKKISLIIFINVEKFL